MPSSWRTNDGVRHAFDWEVTTSWVAFCGEDVQLAVESEEDPVDRMTCIVRMTNGNQ